MEHEPDDRYAVISLRPARSGKPRKLSLTGIGLFSGIASLILVVAALTVAVIVYTPLGSRLPIADQEVEQRYGTQITGIQRQLQGLARELNTLTAYNLRLRRALGEKLSVSDSILASSVSRGSALSSQDPDSTTAKPWAAGTLPAISEGADGELQLPLSVPVDGYRSRGFDSAAGHYGIDFAGKEGSTIVAAADGHVVFSGWTYDDGYTLMIAHAGGVVTVYKHNQSLLKNTGAAVRRGEPVALMGSTGRTSSGSHLHFEVWRNGIADNPQRYLLTTP